MMGSSGGSPPAGTAARRRRTLAHLAPIFDLHLNRSRNPANVEWSAYDFIALIQLTVDTIAVSSGLDGNLGAPRQAVLAEMTRAAAVMASHRPVDEHKHVASHVLDHLLRHDESNPYFAVDYADPDTNWRTVTHPVRVLYETLAADGATLRLRARLRLWLASLVRWRGRVAEYYHPSGAVLIVTGAWTGARWGELSGLQRPNLQLDDTSPDSTDDAGSIIIDPDIGALHEDDSGRLWLGPPKTEESARTITLPPFLVRLLRAHLANHNHPHIFPTPRPHSPPTQQLQPLSSPPLRRRQPPHHQSPHPTPTHQTRPHLPRPPPQPQNPG